MKTLKKFVEKLRGRAIYILRSKSNYVKSDSLYLRMLYFLRTGHRLHLKRPKTFNEKLQWLKLYDRKPIYTKMVDKYEAKNYVAKIIGEEYIIPTYGVWDKAEDIDWNTLPEQFVLKVTHDSGGICICRDKSKFDRYHAIEKLNRALQRSYFMYNREWPYRDVPRRIIAEKYLGENLQDYRVYCFNGEPKLIYSYTNVSEEDGSKPEPSYCDIFDTEWNPMPFRQNSPPRGRIEKPEHFDEMLDIARKISKDIPHLRVDFYECSKLLVGELTFYAGSGMSIFRPDKWDEILGSWMILPGSVLSAQSVSGGGKIEVYTLVRKYELIDYKFYCFNGEPKFLYVSQGLEDHHTASISFIDLDWKPMPFQREDYRQFDTLPEKPENFNKMIDVARNLCQGVDFLRVDMYNYLGNILFSELTFSPCSGMMPFKPEEWDRKVGELLQINSKKNE